MFHGPGNISVTLLSMQGQKLHRFHQKYPNLCSEDDRRSYWFGTTWGWVINDRIFLFGWIIPLIIYVWCQTDAEVWREMFLLSCVIMVVLDWGRSSESFHRTFQLFYFKDQNMTLDRTLGRNIDPYCGQSFGNIVMVWLFLQRTKRI